MGSKAGSRAYDLKLDQTLHFNAFLIVSLKKQAGEEQKICKGELAVQTSWYCKSLFFATTHSVSQPVSQSASQSLLKKKCYLALSSHMSVICHSTQRETRLVCTSTGIKKRRRDLPLQQQGAFENKPSVRQDVNKTKTNQFCTVIVHSMLAGL